VHLPALVPEGQKLLAAAAPQKPLQGQGEWILVIEDDDNIRTVMEVVLTTRGYYVTMASDGDEGLMCLRAQPDAFAVVVTDLNMPGAGGVEIIQAVRAMPAAPKLIAISGVPYDADHLPPEFEGVAFLRKPITIEGLLGILRRVLEEEPRAGSQEPRAKSQEPSGPRACAH
jgi:DNA-binding NtrC family response regulator